MKQEPKETEKQEIKDFETLPEKEFRNKYPNPKAKEKAQELQEQIKTHRKYILKLKHQIKDQKTDPSERKNLLKDIQHEKKDLQETEDKLKNLAVEPERHADDFKKLIDNFLEVDFQVTNKNPTIYQIGIRTGQAIAMLNKEFKIGIDCYKQKWFLIEDGMRQEINLEESDSRYLTQIIDVVKKRLDLFISKKLHDEALKWTKRNYESISKRLVNPSKSMQKLVLQGMERKLSAIHPENQKTIMPVQNGIVDLKTFKVVEYDPALHFNTYKMPFKITTTDLKNRKSSTKLKPTKQ